MAVRVVRIGRLNRDLEANIDHRSTNDIRERLETVCDQGKGMAEQTRDSFSECEGEVGQHSQQGCAHAPDSKTFS